MRTALTPVHVASLTVLSLLSVIALAACGGDSIDFAEPPVPGGPAAPNGGSAPGPNTLYPNTPPPSTPNECGGVTIETKKAPLSIVVALDRSNSMGKDGKWAAAVNGLSAFFESNQTEVSASLSLFPQEAGSCGGDFVAPSVPLVSLPNAGFRARFTQTGLLGGTPIAPALQGAITYALSVRQQLGPTARVVVGLVSDGAPSAKLCSGNTMSDIVSIATGAKVQAGILTYAIGMPGAVQANLDAIAVAGGTTQGTLLDMVDPGAQLTATFESIRQQFDCEVALPSLEQGKTYSVDQVNVLFTPAGGASATLPYSNGCTNAGGWRYDDPARPTRIVLCPQACTQGAQSKGRVEVKLGCETQGDRPR